MRTGHIFTRVALHTHRVLGLSRHCNPPSLSRHCNPLSNRDWFSEFLFGHSWQMLTIGHTRKGSCICGKFGGFVQVDPLCPVSGHDGSVLSVSFSPDGKRIVSGSEDCTVKIWSAETGAEVRHFLNISGFMWRGIRRFATPIPSPN